MKILIPTDYSVNAFRAFEYVYQIFKDQNHEYIFLNIQNARHAGAILTVDINKDLIKKSHREMDKLKEDVYARHAEIKIQSMVTAGTFVDSVIEKIEELSIDLVVMGTKGSSGISSQLMGSNTSNLIGHCTKPLFVIPEEVEKKNPSNLVLAADFVKDPNPATYDLLLDLCYENKWHMDILHVVKPNESHFTEKDIPFSTEGLDYKLHERIDSDVEYAIINFVESNRTDVISIVKSKGGFIHDLFHSSLTKSLGMHTDTPLLVLN